MVFLTLAFAENFRVFNVRSFRLPSWKNFFGSVQLSLEWRDDLAVICSHAHRVLTSIEWTFMKTRYKNEHWSWGTVWIGMEEMMLKYREAEGNEL